MLTAFLYNTQTQKLQRLEREELLLCAPSEQEAAQKNQERDNSTGLLAHALPRCRPGEFLWIDITAPDEEDFALVQERFGVNNFVIEDIHSAEGRPKLHDYEEQLYLVFHSVETSKANPPSEIKDEIKDEIKEPFAFELQEIDCLIGHDYVLTIHAQEVLCFEDLRKRWQRHPAMMQNGPAYLLYELMDEVLDDYFPLLDEVDDHIDELEDRLLEGTGGNLSGEIFALKRALLKIRHIAGPTRDVVNTLLRRDAENGARHFAYFQDLYDHAVRIVDTVDTFRDILNGALDAYLASQGNRLNAVMKTMTATSILLLVPNLIAAIYGMNFKHMPELETQYGYFFVLGLMATLGISLFAYFKKIGWL